MYKNFQASYLKISDEDFQNRIDNLIIRLRNCNICPHDCLVNRQANVLGQCLSGFLPIVSSFTLHFGEEPVLSGKNGAGNIFFGNCNLKCIYCQNYEISQNWKEEKKNEISIERLADIMIELQDQNANNIGLVSPTHFTPQIMNSIFIARKEGLHLPIIYNTNAYDSVDVLKEFNNVIDIYLPDFKYGENEAGKKLSKVTDYSEKACESISEMFNQVGDELIYENGIVVRGLIIRHLILPNDLAESEKIFEFISKKLSPKIHISVMSQYYPINKADKEILITRTIRASEYERVLDILDKYKLENGWAQEFESQEYYRPQFNKDRINPFGNE